MVKRADYEGESMLSDEEFEAELAVLWSAAPPGARGETADQRLHADRRARIDHAAEAEARDIIEAAWRQLFREARSGSRPPESAERIARRLLRQARAQEGITDR